MSAVSASPSATLALLRPTTESGNVSLGYAWFNKAAALVLLCLFAPLMGVIALLVARLDGAPVFFGHYRVGLNGKLFRCLKFRTMYRNSAQMLADLLRDDPAARAEWALGNKLSNDPRITPVGNFLRRTSLDELPQLINVLRGEMTLVGPRPITVDELCRYGRVRWDYFSVVPGMTGLWQVSGRSDTTYAERVALDLQYVEKRSVWLDVMILLKTVKVVLLRDGSR